MASKEMASELKMRRQKGTGDGKDDRKGTLKGEKGEKGAEDKKGKGKGEGDREGGDRLLPGSS